MHLFYNPEAAAGALCTLDADESRHAVRVLRLREGDAICITDGRGTLFNGSVACADDRACSVQVASVQRTAATTPSLTLAVAPTKNPSRMEWLVEKAVEVGVAQIVLVHCDRSERAYLKADRLQRVALSAMKQSLHLHLPQIREGLQLRSWLHEQSGSASQRLIAHCEADKQRTPISTALRAGLDTAVLIGPEGDFSPEEIEAALSASFVPVSLGPARLRTETAAIYAACAFSITNDKTL